jgi:K+-transporting ATPase ATPase C chain
LNLHNASPQTNATIPVNLVTASGSGLDPDISPAAAYYQIPRIAKTRGIPVADIQALLEKSIKRRVFGIFGELRVNVLQLNLDLDRLTKEHS